MVSILVTKYCPRSVTNVGACKFGGRPSSRDTFSKRLLARNSLRWSPLFSSIKLEQNSRRALLSKLVTTLRFLLNTARSNVSLEDLHLRSAFASLSSLAECHLCTKERESALQPCEFAPGRVYP